ncbi:MAG: hypothetical protein D4R39_00720 [Methylophilaceae bacterium]|nr:MAG: hypothetical protein D4R39_00720 [Methylophilaceae bacterium]
MNKLLIVLALLAVSQSIHAEEVAVCGGESGYVYFAGYGMVPENKVGWHKDAITGGKITITVTNNKYDLLYADATGSLVSTVEDGGQVIFTRSSPIDMSLVVLYGRATEIYTFWKTKNGKLQYSHLHNKSEPFPKSTAMIGTCTLINFAAVNVGK